jgi:hypothetical protein
MLQSLSILALSLWFLISASADAQINNVPPGARIQSEVRPLLQALQNLQATPASVREATFRILDLVPKLPIQKFSAKEYAGAQTTLVPKIFAQRMALRQKLIELHQAGTLDEATARQVQRAMRYLRGVEDYLGYVDSDRKDPDPAEQKGLKYLLPANATTPASASLLPPRQTLVNSAFRDRYQQDASQLRLRSGDLLLSRGTAGTSSAIARLADEDTQFSHVGLVYIDPRTKKGYTIEAHIEFGVILTPVEKWFEDGKKRTAVFRYPDAALAAHGAAKMAERVAEYQKSHPGRNIPYDFDFDMNDHQKIFCSEVVRVAFELGSYGAVRVPLFPAHLTPKNRSFLDQLGIHQTESFIPADLDIDPRFDLVAEWRHFGGLRESWQSDAITTKIYEWMENEGLKYDPSSMIGFAGKALTRMRNNRLTDWIVRKRVAPNATAETVAVMLTIESLYSDLHQELTKRERKKLGARGTPFSIFEAMAELEKIRKENPKLISKVLH